MTWAADQALERFQIIVSIYSFREAKKARIWSVFFVEDEDAGHF